MDHDTQVSTRCEKHPFEPGEVECRDCQAAFCSECVVFPDGRNSRPLCIACALTAAGVHSRSKGRGGRKNRKLFRRERFEQRREELELQARAKHVPQPQVAAPAATIDWVN